MVLSEHASQRILSHYFAGHKAPSIQKLLKAEGVSVSRVAIWKFLLKYKRTGTIARQEGSGRKSLLTRQVRKIVEEQMLKDDETTASQLHRLLLEKRNQCVLSFYLALAKTIGLDISWQCVLSTDSPEQQREEVKMGKRIFK